MKKMFVKIKKRISEGLTIHIAKVVAFAGPYIALVSTGLATWLVAKVNILGIPGLDSYDIETYIAAALTALITGGLQALGGIMWFKGHHIIIQAKAQRGVFDDSAH